MYMFDILSGLLAGGQGLLTISPSHQLRFSSLISILSFNYFFIKERRETNRKLQEKNKNVFLREKD